jgi:hypothetical protein
MLGVLHPMSVAARISGVLLALITGLLWVRAHALHLRLRAIDRQSRWASTLRDILNIACVGSLGGAFLLAGLPVPGALLFAGTVGVVIDFSRSALWTGPPGPAVSGGAILLATVPALFPSQLLAWSNEALRWLLGPAV